MQRAHLTKDLKTTHTDPHKKLAIWFGHNVFALYRDNSVNKKADGVLADINSQGISLLTRDHRRLETAMHIKSRRTLTGCVAIIDAKKITGTDLDGTKHTLKVFLAVDAMGRTLFVDAFVDGSSDEEQLPASTVWKVLGEDGAQWPLFNRVREDVPFHMTADLQMTLKEIKKRNQQRQTGTW